MSPDLIRALRAAATAWDDKADATAGLLREAADALEAHAPVPPVGGEGETEWFWRIVDKDGPPGLPSDERIAVEFMLEAWKQASEAPALTLPNGGE